jgi:S-adenosylmethionine:tRNA ribosyltransferase-isomerase
MDISLFDFHLPEDRIAHAPAEPRDACKLLVYNRVQQSIDDVIFRDIINYLESGDVLVINNTKVIPSRLYGFKKETGGKLEVFLVREIERGIWKAMVRGKITPETVIAFESSSLEAVAHQKLDDIWLLRLNMTGAALYDELDRIGKAPLPPYIHSEQNEAEVREEYQTVYSQHEGSVAAPTAGLHFTDELLEQLNKKGVQIECVTLHVGLGTFAPVRVDNIQEHTMHEEFALVDAATLQRLAQAQSENRRIIAVGTTSVRVLETIVAEQLAAHAHNPEYEFEDFAGDVNAFIYPGYEFKVVKGLITNFHLPKSTLLMLVSALMGREEILRVYQHAIEQKYRFYSFGDAMLII